MLCAVCVIFAVIFITITPPESCKESELSSQLVKLLVEHIALRVQLLEHLEKQRKDANGSPSSEQLPKEREEGTGSLHTRESVSLSSHQQQPWPVTSLLSHTPQAISSQTSCQTSVIMATHHQGCHGCQNTPQEPVITQSRPPQQSIVQPWVVGGTSPRLHHVNPPPRPSPQSKNCQSFSPRSSTTRHRPYHIRTCDHSCSDTQVPGNYRLHSRPPEYGTGHTTQSGSMYGSHAAQNTGGGALSHPPPLLYAGAVPPSIPPYPSSHPLQLCDTPSERPIALLSHPPPPQVWRPYSEHSRTSGFCLTDILSLPSSEEPTLQLHPAPPPPPPPPQSHTTSRIPSFLVDHLLDDI